MTAVIEGTVFEITAAELQAADEYEVADHTRIEVPLKSGGAARVDVFAGGER
jgi:hypothetical protein